MTSRGCAEIRAFADRVAGFPRLRYLDFWQEFSEDEDASLRTMFRALFGGIGLKRPVAIWSVFPHHHRGPPADDAEPHFLRGDGRSR